WPRDEKTGLALVQPKPKEFVVACITEERSDCLMETAEGRTNMSTQKKMSETPAIEEVTEAIPAATLPRPSARWRDSVRVVGAAMGAVCRALVRRLLGRSVQPTWTLRMELMVAALRGSWSVMPAIGMVRWRNVSEALSPRRTDGLSPRFVNLSPREETPLHAVWLQPPDAGAAVILYIHGGGFVFGSVRTNGEMIGALARAARA